ncbi:hypothetical protein Clacol_003629 [Clathrus columnatus]|uniref:Vacuolar protein sorting-associated protein VTA1 n=1 Tax=Clathrus columnatus TaxID=1419009 RepID=A0AAV5A490_9AGAM|nr:hypothetical protein Clacol_003629 [Clathrus columnatus]
MVEDNDWSLPPIPSEHKAIAPYFQRAQELRTKDPIMAYWCAFYGVFKGVASKPENTQFLFQVMNVLEKMKANLSKYEAVTSEEHGSEHVEKFAMRVFNQADSEDRNGTATRSTAKKFLASAHFFEVLGVFDQTQRADIAEKIQYARWKAVTLAKLSREGNKHISGEPDGDRHLVFSPTSPDGGENPIGPPPPLSSMSTWSPNTSVAPSPTANDRRSLEMSPTPAANAPLPPSSESEVGETTTLPPPTPYAQAPSAIESSRPVSPPQTPPSRHHPGTLSLGSTHTALETPEIWSTVATPGTPGFEDTDDTSGRVMSGATGKSPATKVKRSSWTDDMTGEDEAKIEGITEIGEIPAVEAIWPATVGRVIKRVHFTPSVKGGSSASSSVDDGSPPASTHGDSPVFYAPSLPTVEEVPQASFEEDGGFGVILDEKILPDVPPPMTPSETESSLPSPPISAPSPPPLPHLPHLPQVPASFLSTAAMPPVVPPPPPTIVLTPPAPPAASATLPELTTIEISRIQKLCRFAISALDYEDIETARKELRSALDMLGG